MEGVSYRKYLLTEYYGQSANRSHFINLYPMKTLKIQVLYGVVLGTVSADFCAI